MSAVGYYKALMNRGTPAPELMLDAYASTIPTFSLNTCLKGGFIGEDAIIVVEDDGATYPERTYAFQSDGTLPISTIESDLGSNDGRLKRIYAHNTTNYYEQTTLANMPYIANAGTVVKDSKGNVAAEFKGSQFMQMPSSIALFNAWHNGDSSAFFSVVEKNNGSANLSICANRNTSGGSTGVNFWLRSSNRFLVSIYGGGSSKVFWSPSAVPNNDSRQVWIDLDVDNATASDRAVLYSDGTQYTGNSTTGTPSIADANNDMELGAYNGVTTLYQGYISALGGFETDQSANRVAILSYL